MSNPFFRRYVFCIIYSLAAEPTAEMKELMMGFEQGRKKLDILNIHQFIIERVARIQSGRLNDSVEERVFMNFILKSSRDLKNKNIEKLQYVDFVSLQRTLDVKNGRDYIHRVEMQSFSQFTVTVAMDSAYIFMSEFGLIEQFQRLASQEL
ncbi:MAG: hypothetical protein JST59_00930 [Actinobacteria bacterium]|nr:hypothetical protein [Actinomycetota bacterium]